MNKNQNSNRSKEEKERRALYKAIQGRLSEMRDCLKSLYRNPKTDEVEADIIHALGKGIYDTEHIFFDLLLDERPAKEILENSTERLGTRIFPVR